MTAIHFLALDAAVANPWQALVVHTRAWAEAQQVELRDAVLLLPQAAHLPLARTAWARLGGWMPRIETTNSLARSLPSMAGQAVLPGQICFDVATDRLQAARMLRAQSWVTEGAHSDPRAFALATAKVVETAHALARAAACVEPLQRAAYWGEARSLFGLSGASGPGVRERLLCRVALEWAAAAADPTTDRLFALRPSAWLTLQAGGPDAFVRSLLASAVVPTLSIDADAAPGLQQVETAHSVAVCANFEEEAQQAAAAVIAQLNLGHQPVALIAQDRALVRRIRALLDRQHIPLRDETGWKLSTTRAAASVHGLLDCAKHDASSDAVLDLLKATEADTAALDALERSWRRLGVKQARAGVLDGLDRAAHELLQRALQALSPLTQRPQRGLAAWLTALQSALQGIDLWPRLIRDDAGQQVLSRLGLKAQVDEEVQGLPSDALSLQAFTEWVEASLEASSFIPSSQSEAPVVITPLAQAMLRPFAAVVFPGADSAHLSGVMNDVGLLSDSEALALGVPTREAQRAAQLAAFALVCRQPRVHFLWRVDDGGDPLTISPLLARWTLQAAREGHALELAEDARSVTVHAAAPVARPLPQAPDLLPSRLSASACEALRACPYRFFALRMLRLQAVDELDMPLKKRDYGNWLHELLHRFHVARTEPAPNEDETYRLLQVAAQLTQDWALDEAEFLPYQASFARFAPRYVLWLHARDEEGAQWLDGERELSTQPPAWRGIAMHGVIDRVDSLPERSATAVNGPATQLIDYKTGQSAVLRSAVKQGEDTQLPYYAALMAAQGAGVGVGPGEIAAAYWFLDESERIIELALPDVQVSAELLIDGIGDELQRLRDGHPLPALGEGRACDFCEARGLCRKDDWAADGLMTQEGA
jgi:ATP-dependent helicase/nuclease subunit B